MSFRLGDVPGFAWCCLLPHSQASALALANQKRSMKSPRFWVVLLLLAELQSLLLYGRGSAGATVVKRTLCRSSPTPLAG